MIWSKTPKTNNINPKLNICVVKTDKDGNKSWLYGQNQVTNDGDIYYATRAGVNPTSQALPDPNFFDAACDTPLKTADGASSYRDQAFDFFPQTPFYAPYRLAFPSSL